MKKQLSRTGLCTAALVFMTACGGAVDRDAPGDGEPARSNSGEVSPGDADPVFRLENVADGVYATPVQDGISPSQYAMSVIIIREDHVVVVDSREGPEAAERLIRTIRSLTPLPVRYLINTHWHGDHVQGNETFRVAFPDLVIVGGATTADDMTTLGRTRLDEEIERLRGRVEDARGWVADRVGPEGEELSDDDVGQLEAQIPEVEAFLVGREAIRLAPPTVAVDSTLFLDDGTPTILVMRLGPAHTRGDVVVDIPELGILAVGDLLEDGFPWFGDGFPAGWADALEYLSRLDATTLLPAHGPVLRDDDLFATQARFVRTLVNSAADAVRRGEDVGEALNRLDYLSGFQAHFTRRLEGQSEEEQTERYRAFLTEAFERALDEAAGRLSGPAEGGGPD